MLRNLDVLVLNKEEALALLNKNAGIPALLKQLSALVRIPVITDGKNGAFATDGTLLYSLKPRSIKVVETTGAGDAFGSGFVAGQMLGKNIPESLRLGQAQAEGVLSAIGAKNRLFTRKQAFAELKKKPHSVRIIPL